MRRIAVRRSSVHGRGVFALCDIEAGQRIIEYKGRVTSWRSAIARHQKLAGEDGHTFFFELTDGGVIDGGADGNSARWINHACSPNCLAEEDSGRVFIVACRAIRAGDEISIDYQLSVDGRRTAAVRAAYACRCRSPGCRGTMLAR
ncbi:SET domain-containing protein [Paraburkholderia humisilvae]|uniref:SET domain-containing protein n=1 Tax=Paraburkholderia humisilvae TaxID=627669 RepID=UPI001581CC78|nr:SET domain-containing protein-lysine N-methyltransferase [Paraburkholderia humisilvae]